MSGQKGALVKKEDIKQQYQELIAWLNHCQNATEQTPNAESFVELAITYEKLGLFYCMMDDPVNAQTCFLKSYIVCKSLFQ